MKSSLNEMDVEEEWEVLPDEGFLEISDDGSGKKIYSRKYPKEATSVFQMNYFICPPKTSLPPPPPPQSHQLLPLPIHLQPKTEDANIEATNIKSFSNGGDQDPISQVFFKKMKETEFVDMKLDSPKSTTNNSSRGIIPPPPPPPPPPHSGGSAFQFEDPVDSEIEIKKKKKKKKKKKNPEFDDDDDEGGLNIWKWSLTGIGAICSFGVAAATVCIIIFSTQNKNKHSHNNQKLQFQIYTNDKRMKQVVHHASKLNEAISAVRGVPITTAHITFGGYYNDASL